MRLTKFLLHFSTCSKAGGGALAFLMKQITINGVINSDKALGGLSAATPWWWGGGVLGLWGCGVLGR